MSLRIKLLIVIAASMLGFLGLFPDLEIRIICGLVLIIIITYLIKIAEVERKVKESNEARLRRLEAAYDELDEQAKIIVRTDLELTRTQEELDKKIDGLYTLHELGKTIGATFNVDELFTLITEPLIFKLGFEKCLIFLADETSGKLLCKTGVGYSAKDIVKIKSQVVEEGIMDQVFKQAKPLLASKAGELDRDKMGLAELFGVSSFLVVPIAIKEKPFGLIFVGNELPYTKVTEGDLEVLSILAGQLASAVENARLYTEIWNSHQELELKIKERTRDLARANEELKRLDSLKSDFVSAVSHELKTPLTSIKGYASILKGGKLGEVTPEQKERLERIDKHSTNLTKLVNDMLDISRIESGRVEMEIKPLSIKDVIEEVIEIIAPLVESKRIKVGLKIVPEVNKVLADRSQIERVFLNLLGNAIKFTPNEGKVTIRVSATDDQVQTDIIDTGIGIEKNDLDRVFDEFYRVDNPINREKKGAGLGLSLTRRIVEAHKGKIWAASQMGKGTTFSFTLPRSGV